MATTENELRRELLSHLSENNDEIDALLDTAVKDINSAARKYASNRDRFEREVLAIIAAFWVGYRVLAKKSNKAVAQSFVTYVDNTVGKNLLKAGARQTYVDLLAMPPTAQRPKGELQLKLEAAHNRGDTAEEARLNKLVDASMRTDAGMDQKTRDEFIKAMRAGKPITMTEAQKRAGVSSSSKYADEVEAKILGRKSLYDGKSIDQRIVTLQKGNAKVVEGLLKIGIDNDMSVNNVARAIQNYIDPLSQAGGRFTAGNAVNYKAVPIGRTLPKGSIRYNAVRIARTEIMQTYDEASKDYYDRQEWGQGWDWVLSNTHGTPDGCDDLANASPHKDLPKRPHPQCTCNPRPRVPSLADFERLVKSGKLK